MDILERLKFDEVRCEALFSAGVAGNIAEAAAEIKRLRSNLNYRDDFIGSKGLWDEFVSTLPR